MNKSVSSYRGVALIGCSVGLVLCLAACPDAKPKKETQAPEGPPAEHVDEPAHPDFPTRVRLSDEVIRDAKLRTEAVRRAVVPVTLELPGEMVADPDRSANLASPIAGIIEDVRFQEGSTVEKGELLAVIRVPDLGRLRSERASALARAKAARTNARRLEDLAKKQLTPEQSALDAIAAAEALEEEARAAGERIEALGLNRAQQGPSSLSLRAPITGVVVSRNAVVGEPVTADQVICEIVDLSELWFLGRVFEKDLGRLKLEARAEVALNAYPKERFQGVVEYIGRKVDPIARTVTARIPLKNHDNLLRVGLFGTAHVSTLDALDSEPTLVVPRTALVEIGGKQVVFVRQADADFELHEVRLGRSAEGQVQVLSGLREGEQVVVEGAFTLKSAVLKSTIAEEE